MKIAMLFLGLILSYSLFAEGVSEKSKDPAAHPCMADAKKFCPGMKKGEGKISKCLKEHEKELSSACTEKRTIGKEKMKLRVKEVIANCKDDFQKFCKDVPTGGGAKIKCLKSHKAEISPQCSSTLK